MRKEDFTPEFVSRRLVGHIQDTGTDPKGGPPILCPFGCRGHKMNEHGYCRHLVGFTADRKRIELRERIEADKERVGELVDTVKKSDILIQVPKKPGASARVYRKDGRAPVVATPEHKHRVREVDVYADDMDDEDEDEMDDDALEAATAPPKAKP